MRRPGLSSVRLKEMGVPAGSQRSPVLVRVVSALGSAQETGMEHMVHTHGCVQLDHGEVTWGAVYELRPVCLHCPPLLCMNKQLGFSVLQPHNGPALKSA